jgi:diguanylate cyclase (GGDEF)-like protein/PAS domain S-box-containing protein
MANMTIGNGARRHRVAVVVAVVASFVYLVAVSVHPGTHRWTSFWTAFDDFGQCITPFIGAAACWLTARRSSGRERVSWVLIGAGAAAWGAGQILWTLYEVGFGHQPVSPSLSDAGFLLSPVLIVIGLLRFVDTPAGLLSRVRGVLEALLIAGGVLVAVWALLLSPVVATSRNSLAEQLVTLAYPVLDAVAIATVLFVATRRRSHVYGRLSLLAGAIVLLAVSDSTFWYLTTVKNLDDVNPTDAGWFAGFLLLGFGAVALRRRPNVADPGDDGTWSPPAAEDTERVFHRSWVAVAVPELVALSGLLTVAGYQLIAGGGRFDRPVSWMVAGLAGLALAHGVSVVVENHALTAKLEDRVAQRTAELAGRERHFAALVEHSSDVTSVVAPDLTITWVSQGVKDAHGWDPATLVGHKLSDFGDRYGALVDVLQRSPTVPERVQQVAWELVDATGRQQFADSKITNLVGDPDVGGYVINTRDVTDQTVLEQELRHQAFHDHLSGLANRALFNDRAEHALLRARRTGTEIAVMMIDLDGFKDVNDGLGHHAGDALLRTTADQLLGVARASDTVARLGGDEFAVLMEDLDGPVDALAAAERMRASLRDATTFENAEFAVTASIGVAISDPTSCVSDLLRDADIAMYSVKNNGKDADQLFEPWMRDQARERFQLQSELVGALDRREFTLFYQPSFELATGRLEGFEALVRWNHPNLGLVPPDKFIALAEESGLIVPLGRWVLQEATRQLGEWSRSLAHDAQLTMAINVSARQMRDWRLPDDIHDAIDAAGVAPQRVVLEITESMLLHDPKEVAVVLRALKARGVRIAIDDFGTGYSSLSLLQDLPIDILKIDKAFVSPPEENETNGHKVLGAILTLAQTLGLRTVAEGVEQVDQAALLTARGCDIGQGFLWARPLTTDDAWTLLASLDSERQTTGTTFTPPQS